MYTEKRKELEDKVRAELGVEEELITVFDWKDLLYILAGAILLAYIIIRSIF